jgi:formate-dependent nitrite reductase membrane component NrfD
MSDTHGDPALTKDGLQGARPDREALTGAAGGRDRGRRRGRRGEQAMVPDAKFTSYYGKPIINSPVWEAPDIPGYLFLGGLAGASSVLALGAECTGRPEMARAAKVTALGTIGLGAVGLVHDLGRPERFTNMLRVFKPTSPMSVGSWFLAGYGPAAGLSAITAMTGFLPRLGTAATAGAAVLGPLVASYTAALVADTAVPAWHAGFREMPYLFVASGASAAGGAATFAAPLRGNGPARAVAAGGSVIELAASELLKHRLGAASTSYKEGTGGKLLKAAEALTGVSLLATAVLGGRSRRAATLGGLGLVTASALTRFGIFQAGMESANDPQQTVDPQRRRIEAAGGTPKHTRPQPQS